MSKLSNLESKFVDDDGGGDDTNDGGGSDNNIGSRDGSVAPSSGPAAAASPAPVRTRMTKKKDDGRYVFECNGRKIYEWEQNLEGASKWAKCQSTEPFPICFCCTEVVS
jgi:hypothetical protein